MSEQQRASNITLVHRFYQEVFVGGDLQVLDEIADENLLGHDTLPPAITAGGRQAYKETVALFRAAFSDIRYEFGDVIADDNLVAARVVMLGVHTGTFLGVMPTGRAVRYTGMDFFRCRGGRFVEHWANSDDLGLLQQLGAMPSDQAWSRPPM